MLEGYLVPWWRANMLDGLLAEHEDIGDDSSLTIGNKSIMFYHLCGVIHSMRTTLLIDVTGNVLCCWYEFINMARSYDFKVDISSILVWNKLRLLTMALKQLELRMPSKQNWTTRLWIFTAWDTTTATTI